MGEYYLPTRMVTGVGCSSEAGDWTARHGGRALLVCGAHSLRASGNLDRTVSALRLSGIEVAVYDAISGEPTLDVVQDGLARARDHGTQVVVGIGGGSALDAAKAIAGLYPLPGTVRDYFEGRLSLEGGGLPWIALPTTAGTGAEVTKNAVLSDPANRKKSSLRHETWFAQAALIDPELTLSIPQETTAASGSDALTQAIESYTSVGATPVTDALAIEAIRRIGRSLEAACLDGSDLDARADMLYGSALAGCALANARLGGVHGMAHPLGVRYAIPHGVVCGLLLPYTMAYNRDWAEEKYAHIAALLGADTSGLDSSQAAQLAVEHVHHLVGRVGVPLHLSPFGVKVEHLPDIVRESLPSGSLKHNPRPLGAQDVEAILKAAL